MFLNCESHPSLLTLEPSRNSMESVPKYFLPTYLVTPFIHIGLVRPRDHLWSETLRRYLTPLRLPRSKVYSAHSTQSPINSPPDPRMGAAESAKCIDGLSCGTARIHGRARRPRTDWARAGAMCETTFPAARAYDACID